MMLALGSGLAPVSVLEPVLEPVLASVLVRVSGLVLERGLEWV
jgi:hypothetical protein